MINKAEISTIPLENFAAINYDHFEKHLVVFRQSQEDAERVIFDMYDGAGIQVQSLLSGVGVLSKVRLLFKLVGFVQHIRPKIIHVHHTLAGLGGVLAKLCCHTTLIITAHRNFYYSSRKQKLGLLLSFLLSDLVICNSRNTRRCLPGVVRRAKTRVIYNGVDFSKIDDALHGIGQQGGSVTLGTICRLVAEKDLATLIHGFAKLALVHEIEEVSLTIVGDGPERSKLSELVCRYGLSDRVAFTGELSRKAAYKELARFDVFIVSSESEGFCNAMVEAAAAGKPIIATRIEPLVEVMGEKGARFFAVGDSDNLAAVMRELVLNQKERQRLGNQARKFVRLRYSLEQCAFAHEAEYLRIMESIAGPT